MEPNFKSELIILIPQLRAFARHLCLNSTKADDLVQDALLNAWYARKSYNGTSSLRGWVFSILRNRFYSDQRRAWRSQPLDQSMAENTLVATENPSHGLELLTLRSAMGRLPNDQKEALMLVGAAGCSYEETAAICDCAVGTIKSRVSRARLALEEILEDGDVSFRESEVSAVAAVNTLMSEAAELHATKSV